jgi:hypothetical protein
VWDLCNSRCQHQHPVRVQISVSSNNTAEQDVNVCGWGCGAGDRRSAKERCSYEDRQPGLMN